jgi:hypothetical protein
VPSVTRRAIALSAILLLVGSAGEAGLWFGRATAPPRPATLTQAIMDANNGRLPIGGVPVTNIAAAITTPRALSSFPFYGTVISTSRSELHVQTQTGAVTVALSAATKRSTVIPATPEASVPTAGQFVVVVPASPTQGSSPSPAASLILLPAEP